MAGMINGKEAMLIIANVNEILAAAKLHPDDVADVTTYVGS